ncbi:MAG: SIMPL domain-containing protein [Candidatus Paceibacterota bacterium]|jgi:hypothetical protein
MDNNFKNSATLISFVLSGSLIVSTLIGAYTFYRVRSFDNALVVTGSAKQAVIADTVKWIATFNRVVELGNMKFGYEQMDRDLDLVKKFYLDKGFAEKDLTISPVFMEEVWDPDNRGDAKRYILRRTIEINSNEVENISSIANNSGELITAGVIFSTQSLQYFYSKLPELRVSLLSAAIADAKARASEIAKAGNKKIGGLKAASSGVVQVLSENSIEISDYGAYDTSNINKEVMVTVKATFYLR